MVQSPSHRGSLSDRCQPWVSGRELQLVSIPFSSEVFQTVTRERMTFGSGRFNPPLIEEVFLTVERRQACWDIFFRFNPLLIGEVFLTVRRVPPCHLRRLFHVSIPFSSGKSFLHYLQMSGVKDKDTKRFNPLRIGEMFRTAMSRILAERIVERFNPLRIGAHYSTCSNLA